MSITDNLFGAIDSIASAKINSTPIDLTVTATIVKLQDAAIGEYKVTYQGATYSAYAQDVTASYSLAEEVYVLVPEGNFSSTKVILGKADFSQNTSYSDQQALMNQWRTKGANWLSSEMYWRDESGVQKTSTVSGGIVATKMGEESAITEPAYWRDYIFNRPGLPVQTEQTLTDIRKEKTKNYVGTEYDEYATSILSSIDNEIQLYGSQLEYIMISAEFQTTFLSKHSSGEYGIKVEAFVDNPKYEEGGTEEQYNLVTFNLSFSDFNGAAYSLVVPTYQRAVFPVSKGTIKGLARVSLFQNDGWSTDLGPITGTTIDGEFVADPNGTETVYESPVTSRNNIEVSNVAIYWCEPVSLSDKWFWLRLVTPKGTSLFNSGEGSSYINSIHMQPRLMYGGDDITDENNCKFVWYRRKYSAVRDLAEGFAPDAYGNTWAGYLPENENGWCPVEEMMKDPETAKLADDETKNPFAENAKYRLGTLSGSTFKEVSNSDHYRDTLEVPVSEVPWKWEYLCVCYYNTSGGTIDEIYRSSQDDSLIWLTQTVTNQSSIHDFELPAPIIPPGSNEIYLRTRNNSAAWIDGIYYNDNDHLEPHPELDWYCRWWTSAGKSYDAMQESVDDRYVKGMKKITHYVNNEAITFKAQVYGVNPENLTAEDIEKMSVEDRVKRIADLLLSDEDQSTELGQYEIANLERTIAPEDSPRISIEFLGQTHHSYNANGVLNNSSASGTQYSITPVVTVLDSSIMNFDVDWIAPDGTSLTTRSAEETALGTGYNLATNTSMLKDMWSSYPTGDNTQCVLNYKVNDAYDVNRVSTAENTFTFRITYINGYSEDVYCTITYSMSGNQGTQGSEWVANIKPCNYSGYLSEETAYSPYSKDISVHPSPLIVDGPLEPSLSDVAKKRSGDKICLRPFITRNGINIEDLTESDGYLYKVYWDARIPSVVSTQNARASAENESFLKFSQVSDRDNDDFGTSGGGVEYSPLDGAANSKGDGDKDAQAFTLSTDLEAGENVSTTRTYGAINVEWADKVAVVNEKAIELYRDGVTYEELDYPFIVRARIEIFHNNIAIATINSYYPIDVIFTENDTSIQIDSSKIKENWPREVQYTSSGFAPIVSSYALEFLYGDNIHAQSTSKTYTATPVNLTPEIQDINDSTQGITPRGEWSLESTYERTATLVDVVTYSGSFFRVKNIGTILNQADYETSTEENISLNIAPQKFGDEEHPWQLISSLIDWRLYPREYYFFENMANGALKTDIVSPTGEWEGDLNPDFESWVGEEKTATYVRPIVYYINQFGNEMINGWDGQSIELNEEEGFILAPTVGAGWKHPTENTFSGVVMGIDTSQCKTHYLSDYGGFSADNIQQNPYMTGVYGYQDGHCSFGIMENGTAFFGRSDTGGRITIDGFNAQIYGGSTMEGETGLDADMRNKMRLSFIDFGGAGELDFEDEIFENSESVLSTEDSLENDKKPYAERRNIWLETYVEYSEYMKEVDQSEYAQDLDYRREIDERSNWYISELNTLEAGPLVGPSVNGKMGICLDSFDVGSVEEVMGETLEGETEDESEKLEINFNFEHFFAPGSGIFNENTDYDPSNQGVDSLAARYGGYYSGTSFSTPAIEVGSYKDWVIGDDGRKRRETRPDWIRAYHRSDYDENNPEHTKIKYYRSGMDLVRKYTPELLKTEGENMMSLEIPGYRKFLVTYDGTMYAMNAFIRGNIVGSNIVASQFFNAEGSYVVFENGDLAIGIIDKEDWQETAIKNDQDLEDLWSAKVPEVEAVYPTDYLSKESVENFTTWSEKGEEKGYAFFVSHDGTLVCNDVHIGGGELNIGGFHILPEGKNGTGGDVVSYGTMYLIGKSPEKIDWDTGEESIEAEKPDLGDVAVEGWGDFNLRGRLVNLGPVFLGGKAEKERPGTKINGSVLSLNSPNSQNSPFSIVPEKMSEDSEFNSEANLPVQIGVWPLCFYASQLWEDIEEEDRVNGNWVTLSSGGGNCDAKLPDFSQRMTTSFEPSKDEELDEGDDVATDNDEVSAGESNLSDKVFWRVDQLGQWSDAMIFTNTNFVGNISDSTSLTFDEHGLSYLGWWTKTGKDGEEVHSLAIENYSHDAPNLVFETPEAIRISTRGTMENTRGRRADEDLGEVDSSISLTVGRKTGQTKSSSMVLKSGVSEEGEDIYSQDFSSILGGTIFLGGIQSPEVETDSYGFNAFISLNGIGGYDSNGYRTASDELGNEILKVPSYRQGQIWIKSAGMAIDGAIAGVNYKTGEDDEDGIEGTVMDTGGRWSSTIRLNRGPQGDPDSETGEFSGMESGTSTSSSVFIGAKDIEIVSNKVLSQDDEGNGALILRIGGTFDENGAKIKMEPGDRAFSEDDDTSGDRIIFSNVHPENQYGIYARFA